VGIGLNLQSSVPERLPRSRNEQEGEGDWAWTYQAEQCSKNFGAYVCVLRAILDRFVSVQR
jgi:hypothetical protein